MSKFTHYLFAAIGCCLSLCVTGVASISPQNEIGLKKGQPLVVKIPFRLLKYDGSSIATGAQIYVVNVSAAGETITVEGASDWQTRGWPLMVTLFYEKSDRHKEYTEVECRSSLAYVKLRFSPDTRDLNAALRQITYLDTAETFESSAEFKSLVEKLLPVTFRGALSGIPRDKQLQLMKELAYNDDGFGLEEFKGKQYIAFSSPGSTTVVDSLELNQAERVVAVLKGFVLAGFNKIAPFITDANGIYGIKVRTRIFYKNFRTERRRQPHVEVLEFFAPYDLVERFYNQEITAQKLVEGIFIWVDGKRLEVALSKAARL